MSKAVMISIQPKWCELIASGKKTIEVRKSKPKLDTPFKCYIYCTNQKIMGELLLRNGNLIGQNRGFRETGDIPVAGKVIGEFVCDYVEDIACEDLGYEHIYYTENGDCINEKAQITNAELKTYLGVCSNGNILGYAWHISQLKIYDKPKELSEFYKSNEIYCNNCKYMTLPPNRKATSECDRYCSKYNAELDFYDWFLKVEKCKRLTRPFQSWGYIAEVEE